MSAMLMPILPEEAVQPTSLSQTLNSQTINNNFIVEELDVQKIGEMFIPAVKLSLVNWDLDDCHIVHLPTTDSMQAAIAMRQQIFSMLTRDLQNSCKDPKFEISFCGYTYAFSSNNIECTAEPGLTYKYLRELRQICWESALRMHILEAQNVQLEIGIKNATETTTTSQFRYRYLQNFKLNIKKRVYYHLSTLRLPVYLMYYKNTGDQLLKLYQKNETRLSQIMKTNQVLLAKVNLILTEREQRHTQECTTRGG